MPRISYVDAVGMRTRVLEEGPAGADEAVVCLHGVPGSADSWVDLLARVGPFARAVAYDLPGFGEADRPPEWDYTSGSYANHMAGVLDALGIRRAHLVLTDLGSVGLWWAASHPGAFASVVLVDGGIPIGWRWHAVARMYRAPVLGALAERAGRVGFTPVMRWYTAAPRPLPEGTLAGWRQSWDRGARRAMRRYYRATEASAGEGLVPLFRALDRPALVVWGGRDRFTGAEQAELQRRAFPRAEVHVLPGSGHYLPLDDPDGLAALAVPFLRRQLAPAAAATPRNGLTC